MVWYATLMFAAPGYYGVAHPSTIRSLLGRVEFDYKYVAWGLVLMLVGSTALCVGYGIGMSVFAPARWVIRLGQERIQFRAVLLAYAGILLIQLLQLAVTSVAYAADVTSVGPSWFLAWIHYSVGVMPLVLALMVVGAIRQGWPRTPIALAWLIQCGLIFVSGFSKPMLNLILVFALASLLAGIRLRRLLIPGVLGLALAVLVVPIAEDIRVQLYEGQFDGSAGAAPFAVLTAFDQTWGQGSEVGWTVFSDKLIERQTVSAMSPGVMMSLTPSVIPFQGADKLLAIPTYLVPRALWPDKPIITTGRWLSSTYFGYDSTTVNSAAATLYGDLYIISGWWAAILGSVLLGMLLALVAKNTLGAGLGTVLVALVQVYVHVGSGYVSEVLAIVQQFVVLMVCYWGIVQLSRNRRRVMSTTQST
jgi:hypothetical protein